MNIKTLVLLTVMSGLFFGSWMGFRIVKAITYGIEVGGHLKRAADANIPSLAVQELKTALKNAKSRSPVEGYTSIIYQTPDADVGFWYTNLNESLKELDALPEDATPLEKSNMLMKLRETILDSGGEGDHVTHPGGISVYPYNTSIAVWGMLSTLIVTIFGVWLAVRLHEGDY